MAEFSRGDTPLENPEYPQGVSQDKGPELTEPFSVSAQDVPFSGTPRITNLLPKRASGGSARWNRSAGAVGWGMGTAVSTVRHLPRSVDDAKFRLRIAGGRVRQSASAAAIERMDSVAERASSLRDAAAERVAKLSDEAGRRVSQLSCVAANRLEEFRAMAKVETERARRNAQARIFEARRQVRHWRQEYPVHTVAALGGAAFLVGVALRAWRSNDE